MTPAQLSAQASQAATQGQNMLSQDQGQAASYGSQYNTDTSQANQDNANLQAYTNQMQGAYDPNTGVGNAESMYNYNLGQGEQAQGFNPQALAGATQNLTQTENALNNVNNASQSSTGGYGLSGSQLGQYYGSLSQPLQQAAQTQNTAVGNMQQLYQNALTQAQQGTTLGVQGEQNTSSNLNQIYQNAQNQAAQALSQVQFYSQLASTQGGLNAQQQQTYASAVAGLQQAQAAMTQAQAASNLANTQAAQIQQAIAANTTSTPGSTGAASGTPTNPVIQGAQTSTFSPSNITNELGNVLGAASQTGASQDIKNLISRYI